MCIWVRYLKKNESYIFTCLIHAEYVLPSNDSRRMGIRFVLFHDHIFQKIITHQLISVIQNAYKKLLQIFFSFISLMLILLKFHLYLPQLTKFITHIA